MFINFKEYVEQKKTLNEGLVYFKNSNKLRKLYNKMEQELLLKVSNPEHREELKKYINQVKQATKEFEDIEQEYIQADNKEPVVKKYKKLKIKYIDILAKTDKPLLSIFKQYGSSLLYFAIIQAFNFLLFPKIFGSISMKK